MQSLRRFYGLLLHLFPKTYWEEYGEELQVVFNLSLEDAVKTGKLETARVGLCELASLPKAMIYEHLRERRKKMGGRFLSYLEFAPGSRSEALAALAPLLILVVLTNGIYILFSSFGVLPGWMANPFVYSLIGLFFILLLLGFAKGLPRWSMPYLGMLLALFSVYSVSVFIYAYYGGYDLYERSWMLGALVNQMYLWSGLIVFVLLVVMASAILPVFRPFRRDWTQLCFLVYGTAPFAVVLAFDDYQGVESFTLLALSIQASGIWFYLKTHGKWKRFLVLFAGLTLSMWTVGISKVILAPGQSWFRGNALDWWGPEMMSPVIMWVWLALAMLLPSVIHFFPKIKKPSPAG